MTQRVRKHPQRRHAIPVLFDYEGMQRFVRLPSHPGTSRHPEWR